MNTTSGLEQSFVDAGLCAWDARRAPHPQGFALVAIEFMQQQWREVVAAQAAALRRAGQPGYPSHEDACRIIADDLDRMADEGV